MKILELETRNFNSLRNTSSKNPKDMYIQKCLKNINRNIVKKIIWEFAEFANNSLLKDFTEPNPE